MCRTADVVRREEERDEPDQPGHRATRQRDPAERFRGRGQLQATIGFFKVGGGIETEGKLFEEPKAESEGTGPERTSKAKAKTGTSKKKDPGKKKG